jgi:hypothetical protein
MGEQDVREQSKAEEIRVFLRHLLKDVRAFEQMLEEKRFETGVRRIGAEQELFLVDQHWRPAPIATEVLEAVADPHFTTELARFNLEFNPGRSAELRRRRGVGRNPTHPQEDRPRVHQYDTQPALLRAQRGDEPAPRRCLRILSSGA